MKNRELYRFFVYWMFSIVSFFIACPPLYADVLDEVIKDFYHSSSDGRFDTLLSRSDIEIDSDNSIVSNATVANIRKAILFYQSIVDKGGWPQLPYDKSLQLGSTSILVQKLRERLIISRDLDSSKGFSTVFDSYVESAVKYFQVRHGLPPDGIVTESTIRAMNVPADVRLRQLRVNLDRILALLKKNMGNRYVIVNIPSATIDAVEGDKVVWSSVAIVGRTDRQTPILHSKINRIVLNPYWVIPRSIIKNDVMALMRQDPSYLTESNIHLINYEGVEVKPEDVDWHASEAPNLIFRQDPGKINAMASTKIEFYSQSNAYMHDTPEPALFRNPMRFETSGCVRVSNITNLSVWLLKDTPGWSRNNIEKVIQTRKTTPIIVNNPISVHFVYISAWSAKDLVVQFRDDVYGLDNILKASVPLSTIHSIQPQPAD